MMISKFLVFGFASGQAVAKAIMADPRCDEGVKCAIHAGLTGNTVTQKYTYTVESQSAPKWYELMFAEIAE